MQTEIPIKNSVKRGNIMAKPSEDEIQEIIEGAESKAGAINQLFDAGLTKGEIMKYGFAEATVRKEVNKRKAEGKDVAGSGTSLVERAGIPAMARGTERVVPEYLVAQIADLLDGDERIQKALFAGMLLPFLGSHLFGESTKNIVNILNSIKTDNSASLLKAIEMSQEQAHQAAIEASQYTAEQLAAGQKEAAIAGAKNPLQAEMFDAMRPFFKHTMNSIMKQFAPGISTSLPEGWTRRTVKPKTAESETEESKESS